MLEITLFLKGEGLFLDNVKSYNKKKDSLLNRNILNISVNYNKSVDVGKPYIHYIAVMNKVSRKSLDVNIRTLLTKGFFCYRSLDS